MANEEQMTLEEIQPTVVEQHEETTEIAELNNMDNREMSVYNSSVFTSLQNFKDAFMIGKYFAQSSLVPQAYQNKPMDCAIAVDIANRMGVSPMFVMQNLWVVRGIPSWSGQACMGIIKACKRYKDAKYVYTGERGKDSWGCHVTAIEVSTGQTINGAEVTIDMAKKEGWYNKNGSKWQTIPELMLGYRAATFFARLYCPNELMGFKVEGEVEDSARAESKKLSKEELEKIRENNKKFANPEEIIAQAKE